MQETKLQGAFITIDTDYPLNDHILLIGDAGGFCNRVTGEGLFYAFQTAKNAHEAILSNQPFSKVNKLYFHKKTPRTLDSTTVLLQIRDEIGCPLLPLAPIRQVLLRQKRLTLRRERKKSCFFAE